MQSSQPSKIDIENAYQRIQKYIHKTPILTSSYINKISNADVFFKCQNLQKTGSFKVRGAANKILQLKDPKTLCTFSSGNHAQAVAYMGQQLGLKSYIVMPSITPQVKKNAVRGYQAEIIQSGPTAKEQQQASTKITQQTKGSFIHPFNDFQIIAGASTCAYEIFQQKIDLDYLVVPVGGGGFCSGTLLATHYFSPKTVVIGVEPYLARDAKDSLQKGSVQPQYPPKTLAEGVRTNIGNITFSVIQKYLTDIILVEQSEMIDACQLFLERMKLVVEISGALVLAAIIKDNRFKGKKVGAIISGGNIDMSILFKELKSKI